MDPETASAGPWSVSPPREQRRPCGILGHRPVVHPELEQERVRRPDLPARRDPEDLHDLLAVEVGPDRGQLLLLRQPRDPGLELVIGTTQTIGLALVAGRAVGAGEDVQAIEQLT